MSLAFVFPGQASQSIGMMSALAKVSPIIQATFAEASDGAGLRSVAALPGGPAKLLNSTECTQPAMLTAGIATYRLWRERGGAKPVMMAGPQSRRVQCAWWLPDYLGFQGAVDLVSYRGELMQAAVPSGQGAMAAILGLEDADVKRHARKRRRAKWSKRSISTHPARW
jgi:[acyl-carrier-protein] S-malonyltransferase